MKKILLIITVVVILGTILFVLTGCGNNDDSDSNTSNNSINMWDDTDIQTLEDAGKRGNLVVMTWNGKIVDGSVTHPASNNSNYNIKPIESTVDLMYVPFYVELTANQDLELSMSGLSLSLVAINSSVTMYVAEIGSQEIYTSSLDYEDSEKGVSTEESTSLHAGETRAFIGYLIVDEYPPSEQNISIGAGVDGVGISFDVNSKGIPRLVK